MPQLDAIHFDVAALVVMLVTVASLYLRHMTRGATNRVYLTAMVLVLATVLARLGGELYSVLALPGIVQSGAATPDQPPLALDAFTLLYCALRSLTAPVFLVLIATVSGTTHLLNISPAVRIALWGPMLVVLALILTNPLHHLVYYYVGGAYESGMLAWTQQFVGLYYSITGIVWLVHWRQIFGTTEFYTLLAAYPIALCPILVQQLISTPNVNMFVTAVIMMLVSAFVIRPERRLDALVGAASFEAYQAKCNRAIITGKPLCLVYVEIVNLEKLRELMDKAELQNTVRQVAANLSGRLERDDVLYYLRNGLFCISPRNIDPAHALEVATRAHEEGKAQSAQGSRKRSGATEMRTCIVRVPEDVDSIDAMKAFVLRFSRLVPTSTVTTYSELSENEGFDLEMALSSIVADAIENRSFDVYYQPILHLGDGSFRSAEALVRLEDARFGQIPPSLFIPEAEENGTIDEIGTILLEKVFAFLSRTDFAATGLDYIEVNLSVDQCIRKGLADEIVAMATEHGVDPKRLNLEITESSSSYSQEAIADNVVNLAAAGFTFALDDYGVGYSNLSRLLELPFSLVKLDQSLVQRLDDPAMKTVMGETISMMKAIGKETLAEGVETQAQADELKSMGIDYIQGFRYAQPMPAEEFTAFLIEHNARNAT